MAAAASSEGPEALVRRFSRRVFDARDLTARAMLTADFRWRGSLGSESQGVEDFLAYATAAQVAMPDLAVSLDEVAVAGTQVWARLRFSATHRGELLGQPGTGRRVSYVGQAVHDVRDGRLGRVWVVADTLSLYRQIVARTAPGR
jgi:predicted ester cyclase